jgi:predicted deacylase
MIINNTTILPGENKKILVNIARLPSHNSINIHINVARAVEPGPVLLLLGGLHGDEINGIEIVRRLVENGYNIPEKGSVISIPIINIFGFLHSSRYVPDGKDVNRSFPGNKNGSLASRVAYFLREEIIPQIDFGIDFHTGGDDRTNYPQIRCMMDDLENELLAKAFAAPFTLHSKYRPNSLRRLAAKSFKKMLVYEGGESSRFDEFAIQQGVDGTLRLMNYLGLSSFKLEDPEYVNKVIKSSSWVRARVSGLFQSNIISGQKVLKNQIIGYITDPFGESRKKIKSPVTGYIIGLNYNPILHQGDAIAHIGVVKSN